MADTKISALPASTTPLAGTEVLPIVQSGVTRQVSVANLTAGRAVSVASLTASTGNIVIGTSGQGIDFSATPGTGTSELFSDYEEGTFTAGFSCGSGSITLNSSFNTCSYTKTGRQVTVTGYLQVSSVSTPSGFLNLTGLPFTINSANSGFPTGAPFLNTTAAITGTPVMLGYAGTTTVNFRRMTGGSAIDDMAAYFGAGSQIIFTLVYIV
jgi:hypothetical protein